MRYQLGRREKNTPIEGPPQSEIADPLKKVLSHNRLFFKG
jgi:hypothetical protein